MNSLSIKMVPDPAPTFHHSSNTSHVCSCACLYWAVVKRVSGQLNLRSTLPIYEFCETFSLSLMSDRIMRFPSLSSDSKNWSVSSAARFHFWVWTTPDKEFWLGGLNLCEETRQYREIRHYLLSIHLLLSIRKHSLFLLPFACTEGTVHVTRSNLRCPSFGPVTYRLPFHCLLRTAHPRTTQPG